MAGQKPRLLRYLFENPKWLIFEGGTSHQSMGGAGLDGLTDDTISQAVSQLRRALGDDDPDHPLFTQTAHGRRVRFVAEIESDDLGNAKPTAEPKVDAGQLFEAAMTSVVSKIADHLCAEINEILAAHNDRDEAVRFIRHHLQAELDDTEESITSCERSKQDSATQGKGDANSAFASAFGVVAFGRIIAGGPFNSQSGAVG